jgi:phytoene synthase
MSAPAGSQSLEALYAQAAEAARTGSRTFAFATVLLPADVARAANAIYWFCAYTRDLARNAESPEDGHHDLGRWASMITAGLRGKLMRHPVLEVFLDAALRHSLPAEPALELVEGARMELDHARFLSFSQLREYGLRTGGAIAALMTHLIGFRGPAPEYMAEMGLAVELTSAIRTLGDQVKRGRLLLPSEDLAAFGYAEADLERRVRNGAFERLMRMQAERVHESLRKAEPGIALLDPRGRFAVRMVYDLTRRRLAGLEASGFNVLDGNFDVAPAERYWITAKSMAVPVTKHLWRRMSA